MKRHDFKVGDIVHNIPRKRKPGDLDIQRRILEISSEKGYYVWAYADMGELTAIGVPNQFYSYMDSYDWEVKT